MADDDERKEEPEQDPGEQNDEGEIRDELLDMVAGGIVAIPLRQRKDLTYW